MKLPLLSSPLLSSPLLPLVWSAGLSLTIPSVASAGPSVVPPYFAPNVGQASDAVSFVAHAAGSQVLTLEDGFHVRTTQGQDDVGTSLRFLGAEPEEWRAEGRRGSFHYLVGHPSEWNPDVPVYELVRRTGIYDGVDVLLHIDGGHAVYDLLVEDAADVGRIRMRCDGADSLWIDDEGRLVACIGSRLLIQSRPVAYRRSDHGARESVPVSFRLLGDLEYGFEATLHGGRLVIDPTIRYATYLGGGAAEAYNDFGFLSAAALSLSHRHGGIDVDVYGTVYVSGRTTSISYPVTAGVLGPALIGTSDAVVTAFSGRLQSFVYSTFLGGSGEDEARGLAVGDDGTAYAVGATDSMNFPILSSQGSPYTTALQAGQRGGFITAINASGSAIVHSNVVRHCGWNDVALIPVEEEGTPGVVVVGEADSGFFTTPGVVQPVHNGVRDYAVLREDLGGSLRTASTFIGGTNDEIGLGIDVVGDEPIVCGVTQSTANTAAPFYPIVPFQNFFGLPTAPPGINTVAGVSRLASDFTSLIWSGHLGNLNSFGDTVLWDVVTGGDGSAYFVGDSTGPQYPFVAGSYQQNKLSAQGTAAAVITKVAPSGLALTYSTYLAGAMNGEPHTTALGVDLWLDAQGQENAVVCGLTQSGTFPLPGMTTIPQDTFVVVFDPAGANLVSSSTYGSGSGIEDAYDVRVSPNNLAAYMLGATDSPTLPVTQGVAQQPPGGGLRDYFVASFLLP